MDITPFMISLPVDVNIKRTFLNRGGGIRFFMAVKVFSINKKSNACIINIAYSYSKTAM